MSRPARTRAPANGSSSLRACRSRIPGSPRAERAALKEAEKIRTRMVADAYELRSTSSGRRLFPAPTRLGLQLHKDVPVSAEVLWKLRPCRATVVSSGRGAAQAPGAAET